MGRHSAPDDDEEPDGTVAVADATAAEAEQAAAQRAADLAAERRGRHSRGEDVETTGPVPGAAARREEQRAAAQDERPTERIDLAAIEAALEQAPAAPKDQPKDQPQDEPQGQTQDEPKGAAKVEPKRPRGAQSTAADLALIRRHPAIRNRVIGGALVPFVLYAVVLVVLSAAAAQYLIWIWIPMVTAGILIGFVLDSGHKRHPVELPPDRPAA